MQKQMDIKQIMGTRIRLAREELQISQGDLARAIGKSTQIVSNYENGTRSPRLEDLPELAWILRKSISYFYGTDFVVDEVGELMGKLLPQFREPVLEMARTQLLAQERYYRNTVPPHHEWSISRMSEWPPQLIMRFVMIILGDTARAFEARSEQEIYELLEARSNNNRDVVIIEQETFEDRITYNVKVRPRVEAKIYVRKQSERNPNLHCEIIEFRELLIWLYWSKTRESDKDRPESYSGLLAE